MNMVYATLRNAGYSEADARSTRLDSKKLEELLR